MPDIKNLLKHMRGKAALIQGTRYEVGLDGIARNVKAADAKRMLLCGQEWKLADPDDAEKLESIPDMPSMEELREWEKGADEEISRLRGELSRAHAEIDRLRSLLDEENDDDPEPTEGDEPEGDDGEGAKTATDGDGTEGDEDPDGESVEDSQDAELEAMDIDDLKKVADGLEVVYGTQIGKPLLTQRIKEAMGVEPKDE